MEVRPERPADIAAIRRLTALAFETAPHSSGTEARIVDALRDMGALSLSLVAAEGEEILGHVAFSPVVIGAITDWHGLGPLSVWPDRQGEGIGTRLVRDGLRLLEQAGAGGCALIGSAGYTDVSASSASRASPTEPSRRSTS